MATIEEVRSGYKGRLICPHCKKRMKAVGITKATTIKNASVKCQNCGREYRIQLNNDSGL